MVPGALRTVMPCFSASPERGRTCASNPAGSAMARPVGMSCRAPGASVTSLPTAATRSSPADCAVAYAGDGRSAPWGRRCTKTTGSGMRAPQVLGDAPRQALRHVLLAQDRPVLDAARGNEVDGVGGAAER